MSCHTSDLPPCSPRGSPRVLQPVTLEYLSTELPLRIVHAPQQAGQGHGSVGTHEAVPVLVAQEPGKEAQLSLPGAVAAW